MEARHPLLRRQLRRHATAPDSLEATQRPFLDSIAAAYQQADNERAMMERALELSSRELLQVNDELRQSFSTLRATIDATTEGILLTDRAGGAEFNQRFVEMWQIPESVLGTAGGAAVAEWMLGRVQDQDRDAFLDATVRLDADPDAEAVDTARLRDGRIFERHSRPRRLQDKTVGRVWSFRDVTEQKEAENALRASEERYRLIFESNPQPMWVFDRKTLRFLAVNTAAVRHYGYALEEFAEMTILQIRPPDEVPLLNALMAGSDLEPEAQGYWRHQKKDGTLISVEINAHGLNFDGREARLVIARDITDLRQAEDALRESEGRLRQSQKMEAVGQLAGGVAHDFNNLLTAILGYGEMLTKRVAADPKSLRDVNEICKAGRRAASLTQQLLAFSRKQVLKPEILALNAVVGGIEIMLQRLIGEDIELRTVLAKGQARVKADPGQIEQVILNLAVNARDAMPLGGRLLIETENAEFDDDAARLRGLSAGRYVALAVTDTGCGMDAATRAHIFEPFFTTKEVGKGTGLGLSTVYGIVKQSGGQIGVESEVGRGTTFKVYLPRVDDAEGQGAQEVSPPSVDRVAETILVVEDDEAVLGLMCEILETTGYKVLPARNALQALSIYKESEVDLVLTDLVMPNRSGLELTREIRQLRPDARVICMSGNAQNTAQDGGVETPTAFMQKPFRSDVLVRTVRNVLDAAA